MRKYRQRLKIKTFNHYGNGDPKCVECGEDNISKLTIGHINDNGKEERKVSGSGNNFYQWLKNNGFPDNGYIIECFSCNCGKRISKSVNSIDIYESLCNILYDNFTINQRQQRQQRQNDVANVNIPQYTIL